MLNNFGLRTWCKKEPFGLRFVTTFIMAFVPKVNFARDKKNTIKNRKKKLIKQKKLLIEGYQGYRGIGDVIVI